MVKSSTCSVLTSEESLAIKANYAREMAKAVNSAQFKKKRLVAKKLGREEAKMEEKVDGSQCVFLSCCRSVRVVGTVFCCDASLNLWFCYCRHALVRTLKNFFNDLTMESLKTISHYLLLANGFGARSFLSRGLGHAQNSSFRKFKSKNEFFPISSFVSKQKRRVSAYNLWSSRMRRQVQTQYPGLQFGEVSRKLGTLWKKIPDKEKQV